MNRGTHDLRIGGEYLRWHDTGQWQLLSRGEFIFTANPPDLARRFPADAWNDPTRWDLTGLDSIASRYDMNFGDWTIDIPRPTWAVWFGDTWRMSNQFTVNYGVRWDADTGALDPPHVTTQVTFDPRGGNPYYDIAIAAGDQLYPGDLRDINNVAPRAGFTWNVGGTGKLVIRGGSGLYFSINDSNTTFSQQSFNGERILVNSFPNDGLPGFIQDPTRGRTAQDFLSGRYPLPAQSPRVIAHDYQMPHTWQSISGMQSEIAAGHGLRGRLHALEGLQLRQPARSEPVLQPRDRLQRQPGIGPAGSEVRQDPVAGVGRPRRLRRDLDGAQSPLPQQLAGERQLHADALHARRHDRLPVRRQQSRSIRRPSGRARTEFQRHTIRVNGIWRLPYDFSVAGAYLYGSGNYYRRPTRPARSARSARNRYVTAPLTVNPTALDRFDGDPSYAVGQVIPRNALQGFPLHRVDLRVSKDLNLPGGVKLTGIAEVFNLFNHENYGAYNSQLNSTDLRRSAAEPAERLSAARRAAGVQGGILIRPRSASPRAGGGSSREP